MWNAMETSVFNIACVFQIARLYSGAQFCIIFPFPMKLLNLKIAEIFSLQKICLWFLWNSNRNQNDTEWDNCGFWSEFGCGSAHITLIKTDVRRSYKFMMHLMCFVLDILTTINSEEYFTRAMYANHWRYIFVILSFIKQMRCFKAYN